MTEKAPHEGPDSPPPRPRGPSSTAAEILALPPVKTLRDTVMAARIATGTSDVTQAEVDQAAQALLRAGFPPYPTLVRIVVGGSNSTVGPKLRDWWQRIAPRFHDNNAPSLRPQTKLDQQLRLFVSQLEATVREKLQGTGDPQQALIAAVQLGEQQGVRAQLETVTADRDRLRQHLEAMTFKVAELEVQLKANAATRRAEQSALEASLARLNNSLEGLSTHLAVGSQHSTADLDQLTARARRLISRLAHSQRPSRAQSARVKKTSQTRARQRRRVRAKPAPKGSHKGSIRVPHKTSQRSPR